MQKPISKFKLILVFSQFAVKAFAEDAPLITEHDIYGDIQCRILFNIPAENLTQISDYSFLGEELGGFSYPAISQGGVVCTDVLVNEWIKRYEIQGPVFQRDPSFIEYNSQTGIFKLKYSRVRSGI